MVDKDKKEFKQLIRIAGADLDGNKQVYHALRKVKGVSYGFSNAICFIAKVDKNVKIGGLDDKKLKEIEDIINNPVKYNIPNWLLNRRKDFDTGEDKHLVFTDLKLRKDFDVRRLKAIKSYRGFRHQWGLPVRGQRTRSNFRKGAAVGVRRKGKVKRGKV